LTYRAWLDGLSDPDFAESVRASGRSPERARADEAIQRYRWVNQWLRKVYHYDPVRDRRAAARFDRIVVHPVWGSVFLFGVLFVLFQALFYGASVPMDAIDGGIANLASWLHGVLPSGFLNHFITSGLLPGIAGVLIFLPQIALLFFSIALLEETGYMARVVFIMDRFMRPFGLSGKSVVPLVSGTACAIPAVMSTRNMESARERWLAIAVTPLMTCSARLPVYALIIGLVVPNTPWLGISLQGLTLFGLYALGFAAALVGSALLNRMVPRQKATHFLMEMPPYRMPIARNVATAVWTRSRSFVVEAGKIIVSISIVLWFLANSGPKGLPDFSASYEPMPIEESYLGSIGRGIQPVLAPLGYDWKISVAIASSFVAREVFVGTMATLYSVDGDDIAPVRARMADEINPDTGKPYFNLAVGVSLLVFYAFALQCMSTLAVVVRETRSWRFAILQFTAYAAVAYAAAWIAFRLISYLTL
jgi:ferrous iron transport protein B